MKNLTDIIMIYVTTPTLELAHQISQDLLAKKIAACTNILPQIYSHYVWQGQTQMEQECLVYIKTTIHKETKVYEAIKALHTHSCPCIVTYKAENVSEDYGKWVRDAVD